jgi:cytoskeletal protein RodZ
MSPEDSTKMSLTLGEKLRQAREDRGYTISEVSEHTRISPLYLESIEGDDYSILPGGIFNKGFVKSYAKFVGINEQEALLDYTRLISATEEPGDGEVRTYRPEVLTDENARSMLPTALIAILILGVMTAVVLFGVRYLRQPDETASNQRPVTNTNTVAANSSSPAPEETASGTAVPDMETVKVEFRALGEPVSLTVTLDGKTSTSIVTPGAAAAFEPKTSLKLSYSKSLAKFVQLTINGKEVILPAEPLAPKRNAIEFEINQANLKQIWESGSITSSVPPAVPAAATEANTSALTTPAPHTPAPRPTAPAAVTTPATVPKPPPSTPRSTPKPAVPANR